MLNLKLIAISPLIACCLFILLSCSTPNRTNVVESTFYPEGPIIRGDHLYYVEYSTGKVIKKKLPSDSEQVIWESDQCGPAGLHIEQNKIYISCYDTNKINILNLNGSLKRVIKLGKGEIGPNDFARINDKSFLFTNSGKFDILSKGQGSVSLYKNNETKVLIKNLDYPNGILKIDNRVFIAEHFRNRILEYRFVDERLEFVKVFAQLPRVNKGKYLGPDGLTYANDRSSVFVAQYEGGQILEYSLNGEKINKYKVNFKFPTNIEYFEGKLFITGAFDANRSPYKGQIISLKLD
jgi:sugar lactone lactonase YvrE